MPRERRRLDRLRVSTTLISIFCAVTVVVGSATVLDTSARTSDVEKLAKENAQLARENAKRTQEIAALTRRIVREGRKRRDQTCTYAERQQRTETLRLRRTYEYLLGLTPAERRDRLNQFVLRGLPAQEKDARDSEAPPYCNGDGIGLPEPDPTFPERPPGLSLRP